MGETKKLITVPKSTAPKPFHLKVIDVGNDLSVTIVSGDRARMRVKSKIKGKRGASDAYGLRPQQYAATFLVYRPESDDWDAKLDKSVKIPATPERELFTSKNVLISGIRIQRKWREIEVSFALELEAAHVKHLTGVGDEEKIAIEISTPQLALV